MSLNKSVPERAALYSQSASPDYAQIVRFLVEPFLDSPASLSVDCEMSHGKSRVWLRLAFEAADKGRVFGRGGRNIQAIRTVIEAAATAAGQSVYLDIFGSHPGTSERDSDPDGRPTPRRPPSPRSSPPRTPSRSRPQ